MLPMWKDVDTVKNFLSCIDGRTKTTLLLETKEAVECIDEVLDLGGFDEIHIGLNDLHLSYGMTFMFELLADGTVDRLCSKFKEKGILYGFGGIAKLGAGLLPSEDVIMEHYRIGSTRAILSRSFCNANSIGDINEIDRLFSKNMKVIKEYEEQLINISDVELEKNRENINAVLLTHSHPDHIGALNTIKEMYSCCVYASRGERDWIEDIDLQYEKRPIPGYYSLVDGSVTVDRILSDGDLLCLEPGITIQVIGVPGHSRESLCFYYREQKILFTGDSIPEPSDALIYEDSHASEETLKRLELLEEVDMYCPAWDKVYDRRTGIAMIHEGLSRISKLRRCTEGYRGRMGEESTHRLFELICEESNMAEYKKNPLFMRSVMSDLSRLNQGNLRD